MEEDSHKRMRALCFLCCMAYFVSYLTRLDYAACMVEIQDALQVGKNVAGLPVTACFLSYGAGQVIFGFLGDRIRPQRMIFAGLFGSAVCNILVVLLPQVEVIIVLWCINGVFQSMLWPPLVRIMAENLDETWYRKGCVRVSLSSSAATIALYLLAPLGIRISGWKSVFCLAAAGGIMASFIWYGSTRGLGSRSKSKDSEKADCHEGPKTAPTAGKGFGIPVLLMALILSAIVLHGTLKDGITTWMPVYMTDMFGMSSSQSILSASVLPVCSVLSTLLSSALLYRLKNEVLTAALLFGAGTMAAIVMLPAYDKYPAVCVIMMMVITGCMYGVNLMLISRVPGHFAAYGKVSAVSGVLNAATYVGSALSTYVFGAVAEKAGWMPVVVIWGMAALGGTALLAAGVRKWAGFTRRK